MADQNMALMVICIVVFSVVGGIMVVGRLDSGYEAIQLEAASEQLANDAGNVAALSNEDVIGQITALNQTIRRNQAFRKTVFGRLFISSHWDTLQVIELKDKGE